MSTVPLCTGRSTVDLEVHTAPSVTLAHQKIFWISIDSGQGFVY